MLKKTIATAAVLAVSTLAVVAQQTNSSNPTQAPVTGATTPGAGAKTEQQGSVGVTGQAVVVAPEQRTTIKEYIARENVRPYRLQSRVAVGAVLPAEVELAPVPETWGPTFRSYRYVYTGDDIVLVDPSSRRVVQVID
jgi:hypothetical protein